MKRKAWGNEFRTTTVCVDSYENGILSGRFFNPYLESGICFRSLTEFLLFMDDTLDEMKFPQAFAEARTFGSEARPCSGPPETGCQSGLLATFAVKVSFRQNSSWQGTVSWLEGGQEQSFRSALELIFLLDSALKQAEKQAS